MTRISRIISDISVICCFFCLTLDDTDETDILYGQRIARITRNYFVLSPDEPDEPDGWRNVLSG